MATFTFCTSGKQTKKNIGVGSAAIYAKYLLSTKHEERHAVEIFGNLSDVVKVTELMTQKRCFSPAVIGFTEEESARLSNSEIYEIALKYAEHLAQPIRLENVACSVVKHKNIKTQRIDLHITIAQQDLENGRHFDCFLATRGDMKLLKMFSDSMQIEYKLDDPRDPLRANLTHFSRKEITQKINKELENLYLDGLVKTRADVVEFLNSLEDVEVVRETKKSISIRVAGQRKNIRLKGVLYEFDFRSIEEETRLARRACKERSESKNERLAEIQERLACEYKKRLERSSQRSSQSKTHAFVLSPTGSCSCICSYRSNNSDKSSYLKNIKFVQDLLRFDEKNHIWLWSKFDSFAVREVDENTLEIHSQSAWKAAAAIAAAKGWTEVSLTFSDEDKEKALAAFAEFNIDVIKINGAEVDRQQELHEHDHQITQEFLR